MNSYDLVQSNIPSDLMLENTCRLFLSYILKDTPLTAAAKNGHIDIVRLLIENKADVNKEEWVR